MYSSKSNKDAITLKINQSNDAHAHEDWPKEGGVH